MVGPARSAGGYEMCFSLGFNRLNADIGNAQAPAVETCQDRAANLPVRIKTVTATVDIHYGTGGFDKFQPAGIIFEYRHGVAEGGGILTDEGSQSSHPTRKNRITQGKAGIFVICGCHVFATHDFSHVF